MEQKQNTNRSSHLPQFFLFSFTFNFFFSAELSPSDSLEILSIFEHVRACATMPLPYPIVFLGFQYKMYCWLLRFANTHCFLWGLTYLLNIFFKKKISQNNFFPFKYLPFFPIYDLSSFFSILPRFEESFVSLHFKFIFWRSYPLAQQIMALQLKPKGSRFKPQQTLSRAQGPSRVTRFPVTFRLKSF